MKYWSKLAIFSYPLHLMPPLEGFQSKYFRTVLCRKKLDGEKKCEDMFSFFDRMSACDGQMDRQTDGQRDAA